MSIPPLSKWLGLFPGSFIEEYEILTILEPDPVKMLFRVRHRDTREIAEILLIPSPMSQHADHAEQAAWRQNVTRWSDALGALATLEAHPHIARLVTFGETGEGFYVVLQAIEGTTLGQLLERIGPRFPEWTLALCAQVASALDFAHVQGFIHGDLNPSNVLLENGTNEVRLRHFGLHFLHRQALSAYTSPEQVAGGAGSASSDIYALGGLVYVCLTGNPPFAAESKAVLAQAIHSTLPRPMPYQPAWMQAIVARAMHHNPENRYPTAESMVADFRFQRSPDSPSLATPVTTYAPPPARETYVTPPAEIRVTPPAEIRATPPAEIRATPPVEIRATPPGEIRITPPTLETSDIPPIETYVMPFVEEEVMEARLPEATLPSTEKVKSDDRQEDVPKTNPVSAIHGLSNRFRAWRALQKQRRVLPDVPSAMRRLALFWQKSGDWKARLENTLPSEAPINPIGPPRKLSSRRRPQFILSPRMLELLNKIRVFLYWTGGIGLLIFLVLSANAYWLLQTYYGAEVLERKLSPTVRTGGKTVRLKIGDTLTAQDQPLFDTGKRVGLELQLADSVVALPPQSRLQIRQMAYAEGRIRRLELLNGRANLDVQRESGPAGRYEVCCHGVCINTEGARFMLTAQPNGVLVRILDGQVSVAAGESRRQLRGGQQLSAHAGQSLGLPVLLTDHDRTELARVFPAEEPQNPLESAYDAFVHVQQQRMLPFVARLRRALPSSGH